MSASRQQATLSVGQGRLFFPALIVWAIAAALVHYPGVARLVLFASVMVGSIITVVIVLSGSAGLARSTVGPRTSRRLSGGTALVTLAAIIMICARLDGVELAREAPRLVDASESVSDVEVVTSLAGFPSAIGGMNGESRSWVYARVRSIDGIELRRSVTVIAWLPKLETDGWAPGQIVALAGKLTRAPPESRAAYHLSVHGLGVGTTTEWGLLHETQEWLGRFAAELRYGLREAAESVPGAALVPGFAVGDTSLVDDELNELMVSSSLSHLTAVSGSNVSLVVLAVTWLSSWCGAGRRTRIVLAAVGLGLFVILVGPDASVQRAAVMAGVLLTASFGGRKHRALPALGLAILVLLFGDPWQAIQPGFALSVAATAGILLLSPACEAWLRTRLRLPRVMSLTVSITCVAQAAVAPFLLLLQPGLPVGGVIANILAAPVAPLGTGVGLAALVMLPVSSWLGEALVSVAAWTARWVEAAGTLALNLPGSRWHWPGGWGGAILLSLVMLIILLVVLAAAGKIRVGSQATVRPELPWGRRVSSYAGVPVWLKALGATSAGIIAAIVLVVPVTVRVGVPTDWFLVACDVGQGDAILIRDPAQPKKVMLVDTGDDPAKLEACLSLFSVGSIELLVLTHDDRDHIGAVDVVLDRSSQALVSPAAHNQEPRRPVIQAFDEASVPWRIGSAGTAGSWSGSESSFRWEVLAPLSGVTPNTTNSASLVLILEVQGQRILLLGDTGEEEQRRLLQDYPELEADVVKVAHHGSRDQFLGLYDKISANLALVSVGENGYGHPNGELLRALASAGTVTLRTDQLGSTAIAMGEEGVELWAAGDRSSVVYSLATTGGGFSR